MDKQLVQNVIEAQERCDELYLAQAKLAEDLNLAEGQLVEARSRLAGSLPEEHRGTNQATVYRLDDDQVVLVTGNGGARVAKLRDL